MVNQPQAFGNSGNYDNGMPFTLTLGCGTWGGISYREYQLEALYERNLAFQPIDPVVPDQEAIFGAVWKKYGK